MPKEAYYFSHDSNARNDPKLLKLRVKYGMEGYGVYWCIIEMLRDQTDFKLPLDFESIAFGLNTKAELVENIIKSFDLFVIENERFYSESLIRRMNEKAEKSRKASESAKKRWGKRGQRPNETLKPENNHNKKLTFEEIKLSFESQKGLSKPYFARMQELHSIAESDILKQFKDWSIKNESESFTLRHAENSFNIWLRTYKENKHGNSKETTKRDRQNGANQLSDIHNEISGFYK